MNIKKITVFDKEIKKGVCSRMPVRIVVKRFPACVLSSIGSFFGDEKKKTADGTTKDCGMTLTEAEIIDFLNESTGFETLETDTEKLLTIDTENFKIVVIVETKEVQK